MLEESWGRGGLEGGLVPERLPWAGQPRTGVRQRRDRGAPQSVPGCSRLECGWGLCGDRETSRT